jgi:hypothetical protein
MWSLRRLSCPLPATVLCVTCLLLLLLPACLPACLWQPSYVVFVLV